MKTEIFTFCDFAQENGGKLTIVGTFDTIIARHFPCVHPQLSVVIRIRFDLRARVMDKPTIPIPENTGGGLMNFLKNMRFNARRLRGRPEKK
jgi:hypothetical protein